MPQVRSKTVQSVDRAVALLRTLAETERELSLAEVAQSCGLERPTAWRLLWTLETNGLVEKGESGHYRLVHGWHALSADQMGQSLVRLARPVLSDLAHRLEVTASLALVRHFTMEYLDQVDGPEFASPAWQGNLFLHASSPGKAVLAALPDAEWRAMVGPTLTALTDTTITDLDALAGELAIVRERGYACSRGEDVSYSNGASAAILVRARPVAALNLWGPDRRVPESRLDELGEAAVCGAAAIQTLMGRPTIT